MSRGSFCRSASIGTSTAPRAARIPAIIAAVWPKVRRSSLAHLLETHRDYEIAEIDVELDAVALSFAGSQIGKRYDWRALFGLITPTRDWERTEQWDCAELVAAAINAGSRKPLFRDKARVTPQMIYLLSKAAS